MSNCVGLAIDVDRSAYSAFTYTYGPRSSPSVDVALAVFCRLAWYCSPSAVAVSVLRVRQLCIKNAFID